MGKKSYESFLQNYLTKNNGFNLKRIDSSLELIEQEHFFKGGRIDILAERNSVLVGIELKYNEYHTRGICAQLLNYLNYITEKKGELYFVAPKIKYGIYSTLKGFYDNKKLRLFEVSRSKEDYFFKEILPSDIKHLKPKTSESSCSEKYQDYELREKFIKGISIVVKNKKKAKLINSIIDDRKSRQKQLEDIADSVIDILPGIKDSSIKTAYELLKML